MTDRIRSADVIVIGAGIIGLSTAYHLALRDPTLRIIVLECEGDPGTGSSAKATGAIRHQFGAEVNVRHIRRQPCRVQVGENLMTVSRGRKALRLPPPEPVVPVVG
jgi:glycine/D-amino acid oxidase-like deaminating enzyme